MLQQTQVDTVLPYFERWMKSFPDVASLANADEAQVLKLWQGLGYYSRARNLHAGAKKILKEYSGKFPENFEEILGLKGVGRYTAGAIASIAFNQEKPIVDGNVFRVLSRVYALKDNIDIPKNREKFWRLQEKLIPKGQARYFNQALMELGALICVTNNPKCLICPIQKFCQSSKDGNPENYPVRSERRKIVKVQAAALILRKNNRFLIHQRPQGKIMGGLWEFPEWKISHDKALPENLLRDKTLKLAQKELGLKKMSLEPLGKIKRSYTHHQELMHIFTSDWKGEEITDLRGWPSKWISRKELTIYPFSSAHAKIASKIRDN